MRIGIASDHVGYDLKVSLIEVIKSTGHELTDFGTDGKATADYPDFAEKAGWALQQGEIERAVVICGSGVGVCITGNKMRGVYASVCHDIYSAHQGVEHDGMNMLCLGGRVIGVEPAKEIVLAFLNARFSGEERHLRRVNKVRAIEAAEIK